MMKQINNSEKRTLLEVGTQCKIIHVQVVALLVLTIALKTDVQAQGSAPCIVFNQTEYDYGTINQHGNGICTFTFKNTGNAPLVISGASSSCGCTTPMFDRKPIMPGKTGHITVRYNTSKLGQFRKAIVVKSNAVNQSTFVLFIRGFVKKKNNSVLDKKV